MHLSMLCTTTPHPAGLKKGYSGDLATPGITFPSIGAGSGRIYGTSLIACARRSLMVKLVPSLSLALAPSHDQVLSLPLVLAPLHEPRQGLGRVAERVILYRSAHRRLIFLWSCRNLASLPSGRSMVSHGLCVCRLQQ